MPKNVDRCDCCGNIGWEECFKENGIPLGRCTNCGLYYINPIPDENIRFNKVKNGKFDNLVIKSASKQYESEDIRKEEFTYYIELANLYTKKGKWLDIGCGTGQLLSIAKNSGWEIEGIELNYQRAELAKKRTGAAIHSIEVEKLNIPDNTFNVVSMIDVFSH